MQDFVGGHLGGRCVEGAFRGRAYVGAERFANAWCFQESMGAQPGESKWQCSQPQAVLLLFTAQARIAVCPGRATMMILWQPLIVTLGRWQLALAQLNIFLLVKSLTKEKGLVHM